MVDSGRQWQRKSGHTGDPCSRAVKLNGCLFGQTFITAWVNIIVRVKFEGQGHRPNFKATGHVWFHVQDSRDMCAL